MSPFLGQKKINILCNSLNQLPFLLPNSQPSPGATLLEAGLTVPTIKILLESVQLSQYYHMLKLLFFQFLLKILACLVVAQDFCFHFLVL